MRKSVTKVTLGRICLIFMILLFIMCFITACGSSDRNLTQRDAGLPYTDWEKSNTGSAKYLDGDTVLVSIFLDDVSASWSDEDMDNVRKNMDIACDYLKSQGEKYNKKVNLIYDLDEASDICFHMNYNKAFSGSVLFDKEGKAGDDAYKFFESVHAYIHGGIHIEEIMEKYQVNSIGFIIFIDGETDAEVTYPYYMDYSYRAYYETCFINLCWQRTKDYVEPYVYAHEILHLFGARDLYTTSDVSGISREFVDYVSKKYPKDIMLGTSCDIVAWHNRITAEITDITAYFLGWKDSISELNLFPSIKAKYPAVFNISTDTKGNYEDYSLPGKAKSQDYVVKEIICAVLIVFIFIFSFIKERKRYKQRLNNINNSVGMYDLPDDIIDNDSSEK